MYTTLDEARLMFRPIRYNYEDMKSLLAFFPASTFMTNMIDTTSYVAHFQFSFFAATARGRKTIFSQFSVRKIK